MTKRWIIAVLVLALMVPALKYGPKLFFIWLNAALSERSFDKQWRIQGGRKGFFGTASDLELAASDDLIIAQEAASRLHTGRQCHEEAGMIRLLESETRPDVQRWLMNALGACNSQKAVPVLRKALHSDNKMIALVSAQSLGMIGAREAIPELEKLVNECAAQCSGAAAFALSRMGEQRVSHAWAIRILTATKPKGYNSDDRYKRYYAALVLGQVGTEADIPLLMENKDAMASMDVNQIKELIERRSQPNHSLDRPAAR